MSIEEHHGYFTTNNTFESSPFDVKTFCSFKFKFIASKSTVKNPYQYIYICCKKSNFKDMPRMSQSRST